MTESEWGVGGILLTMDSVQSNCPITIFQYKNSVIDDEKFLAQISSFHPKFLKKEEYQI